MVIGLESKFSLSLSLSLHGHALGKGHVRTWDIVRKWPSERQTELSPETELARTLILNFYPPEL